MAYTKPIFYWTASVLAVASLPFSFFAFRWLLIRFHEWRIGGHRIIWIIGEEINAALLALVVAVVVFFVVFSALRRRSLNRE
jgi:hypothetical protein